MNNELAAREVRYDFLSRVSRGAVATAHTASDNLETVLFNLTRGSALKGLCGNLSMDRLFKLFTEQVVLFRAEKWDEAYGMMPEISENYAEITGAIKAWLEIQQ